MRVAVVGAGPSGVAVGRGLARAGHKVTIFEREDRIGGATCTVWYADRAWDLGASFMVPHIHKLTRRLADEVGAPIVERSLAEELHPYHHAEERWMGFREAAQGGHGLRAFLRMRRVVMSTLREHRGFFTRNGFAGVPTELCMSVTEWCRTRGAEPLLPLIGHLENGGYGPFDQAPIAYPLKLLLSGFEGDPPSFGNYLRWGLRGRPSSRFELGFQDFVERLARGLDVRLGCPVRSVVRGPSRVEVHTGEAEGEPELFDSLVIAGDLDLALRCLDSSPEEQTLFGKIRRIPYHAALVRTAGAPSHGHLVVRHTTGGPLDHATSEVQWHDQDARVLWMWARANESGADVRQRLADEVSRIGGRLVEVIDQRQFARFPHVGGELLAAGFYERLERLQGQRRTYYTGAIVGGDIVEYSLRYSAELAERISADGGSAAIAAAETDEPAAIQ